MSPMREALADYLRSRRSEGVQFRKVSPALEHFVGFLEERDAKRVTVELAVEWATLTAAASERHRANRLTMVRGFAAYLRELDPANEVPPRGLLPSGKPRTGRPRARAGDATPLAMVASALRWLTTCGSGARSATSSPRTSGRCGTSSGFGSVWR
jgi:hypothetical protein